jgi:outer membrane protein TolC
MIDFLVGRSFGKACASAIPEILCVPGGYGKVGTPSRSSMTRHCTSIQSASTANVERAESMHFRHLALICFLAAIPSLTLAMAAVGQERTSGDVLRLDRAIELARANNRDTKRAKLDIDRQREAWAEAKTQYYPRFDTYLLGTELLTPLNFTIKAGQLGTYPATGPIPGTNIDLHTPARPIAIASITVTQPITQIPRIRFSIAEQRLNEDLSRQTYSQQDQQVVSAVRRAYYSVLQSQSQAESQRATIHSLEELHHQTERRLQEKAVLKADSLRVTAEEEKAKYQLLMIEDALSDRKEALNRLLGRDLLAEFSVEPVPTALPEELDLQAALKLALAQRPEIKMASIKQRQANLETRIEKTRYLPDISIQANYLTPAGIYFLPQNIGGIGALLTWQPWDWGQKRHNIAQKVIAEHETALTAEDTRDQVLLDVESEFRKLREGRAQLAVAEGAREAEQERLRNQTDAYAQKAILLSDLFQEQASLATTEDQYRQALLAFWTTRADFERALGEE